MKYPIDVEEYIASMRAEHGKDELNEGLHREVIPLKNDAYRAGVEGQPSTFLKYEEELREYAAHVGHEASPSLQRFIGALVNWCAKAYERGCLDAGRAVAV